MKAKQNTNLLYGVSQSIPGIDLWVKSFDSITDFAGHLDHSMDTAQISKLNLKYTQNWWGNASELFYNLMLSYMQLTNGNNLCLSFCTHM